MSNTWNDLQSFRSKQLSFREKLKSRKRDVADLLKSTNEITAVSSADTNATGDPEAKTAFTVKAARVSQPDRDSTDLVPAATTVMVAAASAHPQPNVTGGRSAGDNEYGDSRVKAPVSAPGKRKPNPEVVTLTPLLTEDPTNITLELSPIAETAKDSSLRNDSVVSRQQQSYSGRSETTNMDGTIGSARMGYTGASAGYRTAFAEDKRSGECTTSTAKVNREDGKTTSESATVSPYASAAGTAKSEVESLESLLALPSAMERESRKLGGEISDLLNRPTVKERSLVAKFKSVGGVQVKEFCPHGTKEDCAYRRAQRSDSSRTGADGPISAGRGSGPCDRLHFVKIIQKHTDVSLGDCSFLNTCFHMNTCKYIHYEVDYTDLRRKMKTTAVGASAGFHATNAVGGSMRKSTSDRWSNSNSDRTSSNNTRDVSGGWKSVGANADEPDAAGESHDDDQGLLIGGLNDGEEPLKLYPQQWIQCDMRTFDLSVLGKFSVIMADPPWDIHMELPYGTMSDDEMRNLGVQVLQEEGLIFLWVTGRAMELGRECLRIWGYEQCDEIIWVKTNQLQRIIRTGRTGHWLNHGKEHCLVGYKGSLNLYNRGLDCDVIVAEVRETSHKPDEIYGLIERLSPGTRKLELFGRMHNAQKNWITLGNQLDGVRLLDPAVVARVKEIYPDGNCMKKPAKVIA
jgi:mRNA (2'-O-methyladenosine-N6-)-methyltransferase